MTPAAQTPSLLRNSAAQSGPLLLGYLYSFLSAPVIVAGLGIRQFGIWAITGALAQYGALLDLGSASAVSRFVAAHQSDRRTCGEYVVIGLLSVLTVGTAVTIAALAGAGLVSRALGGISTTDMRIVLLSGAVVLITSMLSAVVAAYPIGLRRMVIPNVGLAIGATCNVVASVGSIALGATLPTYALANAGAGVVATVVVTTLVLGSEGAIPLAIPSGQRIRAFLGYSANYQLVRWTDLINYQTDKIVIGVAIGPGAAGAYELANRVASAARSAGIMPLTALLPTLTSDIARDGIEQVRRRYRRLIEVTVAVGFPLLFLTASLSPLLLGAWLSKIPQNAALVLSALSLAYLANVSSGVSYVVGAAAGDPGIAARAAAGTAVANVILTVALAPLFGIWGVLGGTVAALTAGALVQVVMVHRRFGLSLREWSDAVLPTLRMCMLLAAPIAALSYSGLISGRGAEAAAAALITLTYALLYCRWALRAGRFPSRLARSPLARVVAVSR